VGNLRTAWVSHRLARHLGEPWIVRFEDIDQPRVVRGAQEQQLEDLRALGLEPDEALIQSQLHSRHLELFLEAVRRKQVYPCFCSRKEVRDQLIASAPHLALGESPPIYHGHCRNLAEYPKHSLPGLAWRFRANDNTGAHDFVVARTGPVLDSDRLPDPATFVPAYHWACAIDDWDGGYRLLVRAYDLWSAAEQQRAIAGWLNSMQANPKAIAAVFHASLIIGANGERLEKRTRGVTLPELIEQGYSVTRLVALFEKSFELPSREMLREGAMAGEKSQSLKLPDLGIS